MEVVYECCCGMDVHKAKIVACLRQSGKRKQLREFGTMTDQITALSAWLIESGCQMVAMESSGSYWKPIYNVLELQGLDIIVVNAHHMKAVPGRKTDVNDAEWIADLLQHGLLKSSYIPDRAQRELRDISRYRKSLVEERAREINRLEKILQSGNIKISSVVSSVSNVSSKKIIEGILIGNTSEEYISTVIPKSMRDKLPDLLRAVDGVLSPVHKKLVQSILDHIDDMTRRIKDMDDIINQHMEKYTQQIKDLSDLPGIGETSAKTILVEIGSSVERFPTASHLAAWAGLCPGNNESAGKRKSTKTRKGNRILRTTLIQCAKSAVKNKDSFFRAQYERLAVRRGYNRATVAVAHSMLIAIYHMLKSNSKFKDLGSGYYRQFNPEKQINRYLKKLSELGWQPSSA